MTQEIAPTYDWIATIATLFEGPDLGRIERLVSEYERDAAAVVRLAELFEDEYQVSMLRYLTSEAHGYGSFAPVLTRERVAHHEVTSAETGNAYTMHHEQGTTMLTWADADGAHAVEAHDRAPQEVPWEDRELVTRRLCKMQRDINDASGRLVALRKLDADYWTRALDETDVLPSMPRERQREWRTMIEKCTVPPFCADSVIATIGAHLANRHKYFAERVAGVFRALSPDHKTNLASGFGGRLIVANAVERGFSYRGDAIRDLRYVVSKFLGADVGEGWALDQNTRRVISLALAMHRGEWVEIDGGAISIRVYDKGTCHVRLHEEIVWRLNAVLASECPGAIPESARTRPAYTGKRKRSSPTPVLLVRPLPTLVLNAISKIIVDTVERKRRMLGKHEVSAGYEWSDTDKHVRAQVRNVIEALGGVRVANTSDRWRFDYEAIPVLRSVVLRGCIPDTRAHQFYPTPEDLAQRVVALAEIGEADTVLEPSAGTGSIARLLPADRTTCVEVSPLHAEVLRARGVTVTCADFLTFSGQTFDVVVMNPPFDRGQARTHAEHAASMVRPGGRLVAVLPASLAGALELPGWSMQWTPPERFPGTSMDVAILVAISPTE